MKKEKAEIIKELQKSTEKMAKELEAGKDIIIKVTPNGLKVQSMRVSTI